MKRKPFSSLQDDCEQLERDNPRVAEVRRRMDDLPEQFARYDRHMEARKVGREK